MEETGKRAEDQAAKLAEETGANVEQARKAVLPFINEAGERLRFHDLRHQAITELAEGGAADATIEAFAGHLSREMLEHYSQRSGRRPDQAAQLQATALSSAVGRVLDGFAPIPMLLSPY